MASAITLGSEMGSICMRCIIIVSMSIPKPQQYRARVSEKYYLNESKKYLLIKLELVTPNVIEYLAGQYVSLKINPEGERRSYSIASAPDLKHGVSIVAEIFPEGKGSKYLENLELGGEVELMGPMGDFVVSGEKSKKLFVATGSGIVPLKVMIEDLLINKQDKGQIRLHWGMRSEEDLIWTDNFDRLVDEYPNFVFDQVLSRPSDSWSLCTGHVQDCLGRDFGEKRLADWEGYVCGGTRMVEEVRKELMKLGMLEGNVHKEKYG